MGRHGENIRKRQDGRWEARFIASYDRNGKAKYRYIYGKTYMEAKKKRKAEIELMEKNIAYKNTERMKVTFQQAAQEWLLQKKENIKESTFAYYKNTLDHQILPDIGNHLIHTITNEEMEDFLKEKLSKGKLDNTGGLSTKSVSDIRSIVVQIFKYALNKHYIQAMILMPVISVRSSKMNILSRTEQKKLEKVLFQQENLICLGVLISLYAGLRIGEVCALQWGDFDFNEGFVHVEKTLIRINDYTINAPTKTKVIIQRPKTECSIRIIPLPAFLSDYLKERRKNDNVYLLTGTKKYLEPRSCLKQYKRILQQAGLRDFNFHALRHTFATRCVENNFDIKSLSEIMGHSNVNITMQRYVHPSMDLKRQQMNRLLKM